MIIGGNKPEAARTTATKPGGSVGTGANPQAVVAGDARLEAPGVTYLDRGEDTVRSALRARGRSIDDFPAKDVRGLAALVGKGMVSSAELDILLQALPERPAALRELLDRKRPAFVDRIVKDHGVRIEDGKGTWSVQELANVDYLLGQLPESFLAGVRQGPPLRREQQSDTVTGLYNPFSNRVTLYDGFNASDDADLATVKEAEKRMRGTVLMEIGHAWQIRKAAPTNPGVWGVLKGLLGVVWAKPDFISEWARFSGWTVQPKWSIASLFGHRSTANLGTGSGELKDESFTLFGRTFRLGNLTDLRFDPAKERTLVSEYAKSDPYEDFGESLIAYFTDPAALKAHSPEKYSYIRAKVMDGREFVNSYGLYANP